MSEAEMTSTSRRMGRKWMDDYNHARRKRYDVGDGQVFGQIIEIRIWRRWFRYQIRATVKATP